MKTIRTIKQNSNGGFDLHGTAVIIIAMESGTITIKCRREHHKVAIIIAPEGEAKLDTLCHDEENEKGERCEDEFANTGESGCDCLRVKDWLQQSGIFIGWSRPTDNGQVRVTPRSFGYGRFKGTFLSTKSRRNQRPRYRWAFQNVLRSDRSF